MKSFNKQTWKVSLIYFMTTVGLIFVTSCSEDVRIEEINHGYINKVDFTEIPEVVNKVSTVIGLGGSDVANRFQVNNEGVNLNLDIDWTSVTELVDSVGNHNYTFAVRDTANAPYLFHNLTIKKDQFGNVHEPYLISYAMSYSFAREYDITGSIKGFNGKIRKMLLSQYGQGSIENQKGEARIENKNGTNSCPPNNIEYSTVGDIPNTNTDYYEGGDSYEWPDIDNDCTYYWIEVDDSKVVPSEYPCPPGFVCADVEATHSILVKDCGGITFHTERAGTANCPNEGGEVVVLNPNKPCPGDPVPYPRIASQDPDKSGKNGGLFGDQFRKFKSGLPKIHAGVDIRVNLGQVISSMLNGRVSYINDTYSETFGWFVTVTTLINGESYTVLYAHLSENNRPSYGPINAGDPIGISDISGNVDKAYEHHVHIEMWKGAYVWNKPEKHDLSKSRPNHVNPLDYFATKYDSNLNPINDCYVSTH